MPLLACVSEKKVKLKREKIKSKNERTWFFECFVLCVSWLLSMKNKNRLKTKLSFVIKNC